MTKLYLWHISQTDSLGYDVYTDAVVCATDEKAASLIHPSGDLYPQGDWERLLDPEAARSGDDWVRPEKVKVVRIGVADESTPAGVVCAAYQAG